MKHRNRVSRLPRTNQANHVTGSSDTTQPGFPKFKCTSIFKELHGQPIYGISLNNNCRSSDEDPLLFATAGHNRVSIYECVNLPSLSTLARRPSSTPSALSPKTQLSNVHGTPDKTPLTVDLESQASTATPPLSSLSSTSSAHDAPKGSSLGSGLGTSPRVPDAHTSFGRPLHPRTRTFSASSNIRFLRALSDPDPAENFWSVCWSYASPDQLTSESEYENLEPSSRPSTYTELVFEPPPPISPQQQVPMQGLSPDRWSGHAKQLLIAAGFRGVIRVISLLEMRCIRTLLGHSAPINDLKVHATHPFLVFSASKDFTVRLWNIVSACCVAVFGGLDGHRLEVVSLDLSADFGRLATCSQDHSVRIWLLNKPSICSAIDKSNNFSLTKNRKAFEPVFIQFPDFCTRNIHSSYVDCVHWFGDFLLSKSAESELVLWQVGDVRHPLAPAGGSSFYTWLAFATEVAKLYAQYRAIYKSDFVEETEGSGGGGSGDSVDSQEGSSPETAGSGGGSEKQSVSPLAGSTANGPPSFAAVCARLQPAALTTVFARFPIDNCDLWFIKSCVNMRHRLVAVGNRAGRVTIWRLGGAPQQNRHRPTLTLQVPASPQKGLPAHAKRTPTSSPTRKSKSPTKPGASSPAAKSLKRSPTPAASPAPKSPNKRSSASPVRRSSPSRAQPQTRPATPLRVSPRPSPMKAPPNAAYTPLRPKPAPRPAASPTNKRAVQSSPNSSRAGKRSSAALGSNVDSESDSDSDNGEGNDDDVRVERWPRKKLVLTRASVVGHPGSRPSISKGAGSKSAAAAGEPLDEKALLGALTDQTVVRQVAFDDDARILLAVCDNGTIVRWDRV